MTCRPPKVTRGATELGVERDLRPWPAALRSCAEAEAARALARAIDAGAAGLSGNVREMRMLMQALRSRAQMMQSAPAPSSAADTKGGGQVVDWAKRVADKRASAAGAPSDG